MHPCCQCANPARTNFRFHTLGYGSAHILIDSYAPKAGYTQCATPPPPRSYVQFRPAGMCRKEPGPVQGSASLYTCRPGRGAGRCQQGSS